MRGPLSAGTGGGPTRAARSRSLGVPSRLSAGMAKLSDARARPVRDAADLPPAAPAPRGEGLRLLPLVLVLACTAQADPADATAPSVAGAIDIAGGASTSPTCAVFEVRGTIEDRARSLRYELQLDRSADGRVAFEVRPLDLAPVTGPGAGGPYGPEVAKIVPLRGGARHAAGSGLVDVRFDRVHIRTERNLESVFQKDAYAALQHVAVGAAAPERGVWAWAAELPRQGRDAYLTDADPAPISFVEMFPPRSAWWTTAPADGATARGPTPLRWAMVAPPGPNGAYEVASWVEEGVTVGRFEEDGLAGEIATTWTWRHTYTVAGKRGSVETREERTIRRVRPCG